MPVITPELQERLDTWAGHWKACYEKNDTNPPKDYYENANAHLTFEKGSKYIRVVMNKWGNKSAHAFLDYQGNVYKAASWKTPAKNGIRFNLLDELSFKEMLSKLTWTGSYLYK